MTDSRSQEERKTRQICTFAEEYLYGLTTWSWSGKSNEEVYKETLELHKFDDDIRDQIEQTKSLIEIVKGGIWITLPIISVEEVVIELQTDIDDLTELISILRTRKIVSIYERNPAENVDANEVTDFEQLRYSYFIVINWHFADELIWPFLGPPNT